MSHPNGLALIIVRRRRRAPSHAFLKKNQALRVKTYKHEETEGQKPVHVAPCAPVLSKLRPLAITWRESANTQRQLRACTGQMKGRRSRTNRSGGSLRSSLGSARC